GEVRGEFLHQLLDLTGRDGTQLSRGFGDEADFLLGEMLEDLAGSRLPHGEEERSDALGSFKDLGAACLHWNMRDHAGEPLQLFISFVGGPTISVSEMPKRELSSSTTTTSPRAMMRPFTTTSTGSPTRWSSGTMAPRPSFIRLATGIVAEPRTTCRWTGIRKIESR